MAFIGWNLLDETKLSELLRIITPNLTYSVFQTITQSFFKSLDFQNNLLNGIPLNQIEKARLFGLESEICWIKKGSSYHIILLCENERLFNTYGSFLRSGEGDILELEPEFNEHEPEKQVILWGIRDTKAFDAEKFWFEGRIPQKLNYPLENRGERVKLLYVEYAEKNNWRSRFYRFKEVTHA